MFLELLADPTYGVLGTDPIIRTTPPDVTVQVIAVDDIGAFATLSFAEPRALRRPVDRTGRHRADPAPTAHRAEPGDRP
jgi:hypothetical protein